jgi:S-adenosylmethionine:tRNA ribosyltransferase-isomerase
MTPLSDYDYELPRDRIAFEPAPARDRSRLLVLHRDSGAREHRLFADLPDYLRDGDALVLNETRVRHARLLGRRGTGGRVECLILRPHGDGGWEALVKPGGRLRVGERITLVGGALEVCEALPDGRRRVRVWGSSGEEIDPDVIGLPALPPYIARDPSPADHERYQTVYAREIGAVAAPTAGLHFTEPLLARIEAKGVRIARVVLHVGPGTFLPVTVDDVRSHRMEAEFFRYPKDAADLLREVRARGGRVVAVGTTSTRVLETVGPEADAREGWSDLFVHPPYHFAAVDALITNFHLPRSTLLMLVAAFAGIDLVRESYREAIALGYRLYSYGDAMLIL